MVQDEEDVTPSKRITRATKATVLNSSTEGYSSGSLYYMLYREDFFQLFNWFYLFFSGEKLQKVAGYSQNRLKLTILKGGVDGFSYFSLINSYITF